MITFGQTPDLRRSASHQKPKPKTPAQRQRDHPSRRQNRMLANTSEEHGLAMAIMNREHQQEQRARMAAPSSGSGTQTQRCRLAANHDQAIRRRQAQTTTVAPQSSRIPAFSITGALLLLAVPLVIAFILGTLSINHRKGKGNMFSSSAFIVEIASGIEVVLVMFVISCSSYSRWTRAHKHEWTLAWLGVVATSCLVSGVWIVMRVQTLEATEACRVGPKKHQWEEDPDPGINECVAGMGVTRGMAGMRIMVMAQYIITLIWFTLWKRKLYLESRGADEVFEVEAVEVGTRNEERQQDQRDMWPMDMR